MVGVSKLGSPRVELSGGETLNASKVVLATGTPVLDRGLYFAKLEPHRSYALAFSHADPPPVMYLAAGSSTSIRSVRDAPGLEGTFLLVGGSGDVVGRAGSEVEHVDELREWTARHFPSAIETHVWSAQDYESHDGIPYVGKLPRGASRGRSSAASPSWAKVLGRRVTRPAGVLHGSRFAPDGEVLEDPPHGPSAAMKKCSFHSDIHTVDSSFELVRSSHSRRRLVCRRRRGRPSRARG